MTDTPRQAWHLILWCRLHVIRGEFRELTLFPSQSDLDQIKMVRILILSWIRSVSPVCHQPAAKKMFLPEDFLHLIIPQKPRTTTYPCSFLVPTAFSLNAVCRAAQLLLHLPLSETGKIYGLLHDLLDEIIIRINVCNFRRTIVSHFADGIHTPPAFNTATVYYEEETHDLSIVKFYMM